MDLKKIIVHELIKKSESNEVELVLSDELIPNDDNAVAFVNSLSTAYRSDKILHAIFDDSEGKYFPEKFKVYKDSGRNNKDFISFTRLTLGNLEALISPVFFATGGYFIFAEYFDNGNNFISIFLIRDVEGKVLNKTEHSYSIQTIEYVDTKNLAMACRINENRIDHAEANYLSFTQLRQQEVSEYFKNWISIKQLESSNEYTNSLYKILNQLKPPVDEDTGIILDIQEVRNRAYSYAKDSPNQIINIRGLSELIYQDADLISNYAADNELILDTEFRYNNTALKKFIKLEVNRDGINLKISKGAVNQKVKLSPDDPNIVIIESEIFAKAYRLAINENK